MKEVELPDGTVAEFPAEMSDEEIAQVLVRQFGGPGASSQQAPQRAPALRTQSSAPAQRAPAKPTARAPARDPIQRRIDELSATAATAAQRNDAAAQKRAEAKIAGLREAQRRRDTDPVGSRIAAASEGAANAFSLGLADFTNAAGRFVRDNVASTIEGRKGPSYAESLATQRGYREGLAAAAPVTSGVFSAAGGVAGGAGLAKGAEAVARRVGAGAFANALAVRQGAPVALNAGRLAVQGAGAAGVAGAIDAAADQRNVVRGAADSAVVGAVAGPLAAGAVNVLGTAARVAQARAAPDGAGLRALAARLKVPVKELQAAAAQNPGRSVIELLDDRSVAEVGALAQSRSEAANVFREARNARALERPATFGEAVPGGRRVTTVAAVERARDDATDVAMSAIRNVDVPVDDELRDVLSSAVLRRVAPRGTDIGRALVETLGENAKRDSLTLGEVDTLRQLLRRASRSAVGGERIALGSLADRLQKVATDRVPEYQDVIDDFAAASRTAEAVERARGVLNARTDDTVDAVLDATRREDLATLDGLRVGARSQVAEAARQSPQDAIAVARQLAEDTGLQTRLQAMLGPDEAGRLQRLGEAELRAARNLETVAPRAPKTSKQEDRELEQIGIDALVTLSGRASGSFQANLVRRTIERAKVPPVAARKLAEMATDPSRTAEVIEGLRRAKVSTAEIKRIFSDIARAGAVSAGTAGAQQQ